jgi:hypothetical protein
MTTDSKPEPNTREKLPWLAVGKFLLLAVFVFVLLMLGVSMAHHRFFRGGRIDQRGVLSP